MSNIDKTELDILRQTKIYVAGHQGMVGSAITGLLKQKDCQSIVAYTRNEVDLTNQQAVAECMAAEKPDYVFLAAAKVGGIHANNTYPADFIRENLVIAMNVIHAAYENSVRRLLFLGSSCIYPRLAPQPMAEECLLTGPLEPTNEPYAIAKIAGIKACESYNRQYGTDFRSIMPTNLYGPNDGFHPQNSHVLPALLRRFHEAKMNSAESVEVWGSGNVRREFLHVDDMANASLFVMCLPKETYQNATAPMLSHLNAGAGNDLTIRDLAELIKDIVGFTGEIEFNTNQPDGTPQKLLNVDKLKTLGWEASIGLRDGIESTYKWYLENAPEAR